MGQTLTHGVYLPDEGERNCYSGLAANWQILDTSVGTIAANTAALAGKAPAVHTHTKSDITDFPAYGNAAGTICEGNDSRLSDARTPVAHTHTKSDVTDLLNSNFIPSANNSYDLGSSSYQWNNVYAKGYYYNGVAWGLDKSNVWTNVNTYTREICISGERYAYIAPMWSGPGSGIAFLSMDATKQFVFGQRTTDANNRSCYDETKGFLIIRAGETGGDTTVSVIPFGTDTKLGDSTNKWKSLNGINPGALSLPDLNTAQTIDRTGWAYDGSTYNSIKLSSTDTNMTKNGWLYVRISSTGSSDKLSIKYNSIGDKYPTSSFGDTGGCIEVFVPVIANSNIFLCATKDLQFCKFYPCLGNVSSGV